MSDEPKQGGYLRQAWLVIALALVYGAALAEVQTTLGPRIAENKRRETYSVIPTLVPGADVAMTQEILVTGADGQQHRVYRAVAADGKYLGWVLPAHGQGFADRIDLLIGVGYDVSTITGLYVLDQKETPGLGALITEEPFRERFRGLPTDHAVTVVTAEPAGPGQVRAVTGATISSDSIAEIVNRAIGNLIDAIRRLPTDHQQPTTDN